jgi:cytochrome c oxidase assembly factor CtaG
MLWKHILLAWDWEPSIIVGCVGLLLGYALLSRFRWIGHAVYYVTGVIIMLLALVSPIDALSDDYLFSAHMFQHLLLSQVVPPLLLLGIPAAWWEQLLRWRPMAKIESVLRAPIRAWLIGIVGLWIWHWPRLFGLALENENIHIVQHLCFMVTGCIFWWPIVTPLPQHRLTVGVACLYLFTACTISSLLGIFITLSSTILYPFYSTGDDPLNILSALRQHLSVREDQQLGGLLMWVPCCLVYASAILLTLGRWHASGQDGESPLSDMGTIPSYGAALKSQEA